MNINHNYFNWFNKLISVLIDIFFYCAIIVTLYVFTSVFNGYLKYLIFVLLCIIYILIVYFFKDKVKRLLNRIIDILQNYSDIKLLIILSVLMVVLKIICTIFFNFDATAGSDIQIYDVIATQIIEKDPLSSNAISHLFGIAMHFVVFKKLHIPLHVGMFIVIYLATIINYFSFKKIVGKAKSFLVILMYIIMPSTCLLSFCPTHELLVYLYLSIFIYLLNLFLSKDNLKINILYALFMIIDIILLCMVNPTGMISYVIILLLILLTKIKIDKKIIILCVLILSIVGSNLKDKYLEVNTGKTTINTYTILIHGSNPESLGEQVDGYPLKMMRKYIDENNLDQSLQSYEIACKNVLLSQYTYLITHPVTLIRLLMHKAYILWSGDHYSLELAHHFNGVNTITYYLFLIISTFIYLFMLTLHILRKKDDCDCLALTNYKLVILGVIAVTFLSIVLNKYDLYITLYIYLLAINRLGDNNEA